MAKTSEKKCSFCERTESDVNVLFTGLKGNICDACIENAHELLTQAKEGTKQPNPKNNGALPKLKKHKPHLAIKIA